MAKMVNFTLYIFYHNFKNGGGGVDGRSPTSGFSDLGLQKEDRTRDKYLGVF